MIKLDLKNAIKFTKWMLVLIITLYFMIGFISWDIMWGYHIHNYEVIRIMVSMLFLSFIIGGFFADNK